MITYRAGPRPVLGDGWQDYFVRGKTQALIDVVDAQLRLARSGVRLTRTQDAEGLGKGAILNAPANVAEAQLRAAFWLAVTARLLGQSGSVYSIVAAEKLASKAKTASAWDANAKSTPGEVLGVFTAAIKEIRSIAGAQATTSSNIRYVLGALGAANPGMIALAQQAKYEQSAAGIAAGTAKGTIKDIKQGAGVALDVVTGEKTVPTLILGTIWARFRWYIVAAGVVSAVSFLWLTRKPTIDTALLNGRGLRGRQGRKGRKGRR